MPGLGESPEEEFAHVREGRPPCRPIFLLVKGPKNNKSDATEAVSPMKNGRQSSRATRQFLGWPCE